MISAQNSVAIPLVVGGVANDTNTHRIVIDRRQNGKVYDYCSVAFVSGSSTTSKMTVLAIQESDITGATGFTNIDGLIGTTNSTAGSSQFVLPAGATATGDVGAMHWLHADLRGRARYVGVYYQVPNTTGTGEIPYGVAILSGGEGGTDGVGVTNNLDGTAQTHVAGVTAAA